MSFPRALVPIAIRKRIRQIIWQRLGLHWQLPFGATIQIKTSAEWEAYNELFVDGDYDFALQDLFATTAHRRSITVLDIGANVGFFYFRMLDVFSRHSRRLEQINCFLIEASPSTAQELRARLEGLATIHAGRRQILVGLVGKRDGSAIFYETPFHTYSSVVTSGGGRGRMLPYIDLMQAAHIQSVDLIKCDIQGAEEMFVENYPDLLAITEAIVIELHHQLCDTAKCERLLAEAGFERRRIVRENPSVRIAYFARS